MKKLILPIFAILFLMACSQESSDGIVPTDGAIKFRSSGEKVDVCHNGHVIHVNVNALPDHLAHGDAIDSDGDGFFSGPNNCGLPVDCNDGDPNLTASCCLQGCWTGYSGNFSLNLTFQDNCNALGQLHFTCYSETTWEYLGSNGNVHTYHFEDLSDCDWDDCIATITDNGTNLTVTFDCDSNFLATLTPCGE